MYSVEGPPNLVYLAYSNKMQKIWSSKMFEYKLKLFRCSTRAQRFEY